MADIHQEMETEIESVPTQVQNPDNVPTQVQKSDKDLVEDIRSTISKLVPKLSSKCCIYTVPKRLRDVNPTAYIPQLVSIGPLHHGHRALKKMETQKLRYLEYFFAVIEPAVRLDKLVSHIRKEVKRIRECYAVSFDYPSSDDQFAKMVLVDAAFVIMLFIRDRQEKEPDDYIIPSRKEPDDYLIFDNHKMRSEVRRDLILLENQLPFFILKDLYDLAFSYQKHFPSFADLTLHFFGYFNQQGKEFPEDTKHFPSFADFTLGYFNGQGKEFPEHTEHFTDLLRYFHLPSKNHKLGNKEKNQELLYCAVELQAAGVEFEVSQSKCWLDVQFSNGKLVMPRFILEDPAESLIRNIMAFEQCHCIKDAKICKYIILMGYLIKTAKDVELFVQKKIVVNRLGDHKAVANLVNKLGLEIGVSNNHYRYLFGQLNGYYEVRYHRWKAKLRQEYFSTPFRAASTFAAIILLVLTLLQTVFSGIAMH